MFGLSYSLFYLVSCLEVQLPPVFYIFLFCMSVLLPFLPAAFLKYNYVSKLKGFEIACIRLLLSSLSLSSFNLHLTYRISRPIRRTFFPEKCDLNSTCFLCTEDKYYFQTYKYPYIYYTTSLS